MTQYAPRETYDAMVCKTHGEKRIFAIHAGTPFCDECVRDKLIELGVVPLHTEQRPLPPYNPAYDPREFNN